MRKLFTFNMVTLDGFFEGDTKGDLSWHNVDQEFEDFAIEQLSEVDTLLFGRTTYEFMQAFWPTPQAIEDDPGTAAFMNDLEKVVVSHTLQEVDWKNSRLLKGDPAEAVSQLKQQPGKDIALLGSAILLADLIPLNLIDEHRLMVNPLALGPERGIPLFKAPVKLKLTKTRPFQSGNVLLYYQPV